MVKIIALFCVLSINLLVNAQVDTLKCEESFTHYDTLLGENLIAIWETPPSLRKQTSYECILVDMIIDSDGIPICFRFKQQIEPVIKAKLTDKLKLLRFKPAIIRNKRVESIYTIKI